MSILKRVVQEHCDRIKRPELQAELERELRFSRDMQPSKPLNKTVRNLLATYNKAVQHG